MTVEEHLEIFWAGVICAGAVFICITDDPTVHTVAIINVAVWFWYYVTKAGVEFSNKVTNPVVANALTPVLLVLTLPMLIVSYVLYRLGSVVRRTERLITRS
ncbi:hypothetical protein [Pacificispira sp.]|uniref:hypothetical protein n=1 Tax=Pacificispira sp. TaxID=2888761 RepID=UPI003BAD9780